MSSSQLVPVDTVHQGKRWHAQNTHATMVGGHTYKDAWAILAECGRVAAYTFLCAHAVSAGLV
jgi:hypothetical protein